MRQTKLFAFLVALLVVLSVVLPQNGSEAKKLKLKDLKKLKKYAYLLAYQRKRFYPIPFPLPLPVLVKRQHIYTQIPVVPRYVQQAPSQYQQSIQSSMVDPTYAAAAAVNSHYQAPYYPSASYQQPQQQQQQQQQHVKTPSNHVFSYEFPSVEADELRPQQHRQHKHSSRELAGGGSSTAASSLNPSKYLAHVGLAIGKAYPGLVSDTQRELIGKLLTGEAKIVTPSQIKLGPLRYSLKHHRQQQAANPEQVEKEHQAALDAALDVGNGTIIAPSSDPYEQTSMSNEIKPSASQFYHTRLSSPRYYEQMRDMAASASQQAVFMRSAPRIQYPYRGAPALRVAPQMHLPMHLYQRGARLGPASGSLLPLDQLIGPSHQMVYPIAGGLVQERGRELQDAASTAIGDYEPNPDELAHLAERVRREQAHRLLAIAALRHKAALQQHHRRQDQQQQQSQQQKQEDSKSAIEKERELQVAESNSIAIMSQQLDLPSQVRLLGY